MSAGQGVILVASGTNQSTMARDAVKATTASLKAQFDIESEKIHTHA
jgi:hypothetical protein